MSLKQKQIFDLIRISIHRTANLAKAGKQIDENLQEIGFYIREFSEVEE